MNERERDEVKNILKRSREMDNNDEIVSTWEKKEELLIAQVQLMMVQFEKLSATEQLPFIRDWTKKFCNMIEIVLKEVSDKILQKHQDMVLEFFKRTKVETELQPFVVIEMLRRWHLFVNQHSSEMESFSWRMATNFDIFNVPRQAKIVISSICNFARVELQ